VQTTRTNLIRTLKKKRRKSRQVTIRYFAVSLIRTNKKHHVAFVQSKRKDERKAADKKGMSATEGCLNGMASEGEKKNKTVQISLGRAFSPLLGEITCFSVLWVPPPAPGLIVDPREGLSRLVSPSPLEQLEARYFFLPFTPSWKVPLFLLDAVLRVSLGIPHQSILLSFFPGYTGDMLGCLRSLLNTFSPLSSQIRWARCGRTFYALEIRLDARDYLQRLLTFAISRVTENIDHKDSKRESWNCSRPFIFNFLTYLRKFLE